MLPLKRTFLLLGENLLVPSKGLEPPHRCRYMDLNHARLPIPPRWQSGTCYAAAAPVPPCQEDQPFFFQPRHPLSNRRAPQRHLPSPSLPHLTPTSNTPLHPS